MAPDTSSARRPGDCVCVVLVVVVVVKCLFSSYLWLQGQLVKTYSCCILFQPHVRARHRAERLVRRNRPERRWFLITEPHLCCSQRIKGKRRAYGQDLGFLCIEQKPVNLGANMIICPLTRPVISFRAKHEVNFSFSLACWWPVHSLGSVFTYKASEETG